MNQQELDTYNANKRILDERRQKERQERYEFEKSVGGNPAPLEEYKSEMPAAPTALIPQATPDWQTQDLSKTNKLPWQQYIDPSISGGSDDLISQQLGRVYGKSTNAFDLNNLNPDGTYKVNPSDTGSYYNESFNRGVNLSGFKPQSTGNAMMDAINNKYANEYANKYASLGTQNKLDERSWKSKQLANTSKMLSAVRANEMQNFREQYAFQQQRAQLYAQWRNANEQAKGSFLSSLLQIGIGAIATVATGGAAAPALLPGLAGAFDTNNVGNIS